MNIIKRSGKIEPLTKKKIFDSICNANSCVKDDEKLTQKQIKRITDSIVSHCETLEEPIDIDILEDAIEHKIMENGGYEVAKRYITYRYEKERVRTNKSITEKLTASNVQNQNANIDEFSFGGRIGETAGYVTKQYALDHLISKKTRENHINNEIYIHDLDNYAVGSHNCYNSKTRFVTSDGVKSFGECCNGQSVTVLDKDGEWRAAVVRKYGMQKMYDLTFKSSLTTRTVTCTRNHRWILFDGNVTDNIQVGDSLALLPKTDVEYVYSPKQWCFGFVIGDGCDHNLYSKDKSRVTNDEMKCRLCGDKVVYADRFKDCGWTCSKIKGTSDLEMSTRGNGCYKQSFLDGKIWKLISHDDLCNVFLGYMAADGHITDNGSVMISTSDSRVKEFIEFASPVAGYHVWSSREKYNSTNFKENRMIYELYLIKEQSTKWTLVSIKANRSGFRSGYQCAWCVEEPETHSFTLFGGIVTGNCLSIPFDKLLANGFDTRQTDVRPASSINTAMQLVAVIFQLQSLQQFGGVSATHLDWTMVPYVRKSFFKHYKDGVKYIDGKEIDYSFNNNLPIDDEDYKVYSPKAYQYAMEKTKQELEQATEGMFHNLNTLQSRSGCQLPFTSINYGTCTSTEGRMVCRALIEGGIKGCGKFHKTSIFPCCIFQCMKGVNRKPGDPNYDLFKLALESTAKRIYPNYANVDWSGNAGYDTENPCTFFSTMGCRTANGWDINCEDEKLGQLKDGRGNICPTTIILPTLAMKAKEAVDKECEEDSKKNLAWSESGYEKAVVEKFLKLLDKKIGEAKDSLIERFDWICSQPAASAKFMYENGTMYGYKPEEGIKSALKHGTLAIGQLGLAETLQILIGCDHTAKKGMELAIQIESLFKEKCAKFKKEYRLNFGVYYTPAENLCHTAMKKFKATYGEIKNVSDHDYFTNSIHIPVWHKLDPFKKIDLEAKLTGYSSAGCITYVELDASVKNNIDAMEELVNYAMDNDIPYFAINVPIDTCECGYSGDLGERCPKCGSDNIQRLRRVTGYITGNYKTAFNRGKQAEVEQRVKHTAIEVK